MADIRMPATFDEAMVERFCAAMWDRPPEGRMDLDWDRYRESAKEERRGRVRTALTAAGVGQPVAWSAEDACEAFIAAEIDAAPEALRRLGEWLSQRMDEDDANTASRMVLGAMMETNAAIRAVGANAAQAAAAGVPEGWRCFHCGEEFTDRESAALHFGTHERQEPACLIGVAKYRELEALQLRYAEEDAEVHRTMRRMESEHQLALRRAEEGGYAKGLRDAVAYPADAGSAPPQPLAIAQGLIDHAGEVGGEAATHMLLAAATIKAMALTTGKTVQHG